MAERWRVGVNGYYRTVWIMRSRGPWWVCAMEAAVERIEDWIPEWEIPLIGRIPITRDGERMTVEDYYGTCIGCLFCLFVAGPIRAWCCRRYTIRQVEVPADELVRAWGTEAPAYWHEEIARGAAQLRDEQAQQGASQCPSD